MHRDILLTFENLAKKKPRNTSGKNTTLGFSKRMRSHYLYYSSVASWDFFFFYIGMTCSASVLFFCKNDNCMFPAILST